MMSSETQTNSPPPAGAANPLRLWPALVILSMMWLAIMVPPRLYSFGLEIIISLGVVALMLLAFVFWWLFFSRVPRRDRLLGFLLLVVGLTIGGMGIFHESARQGISLVNLFMPGVFTAVALGLLFTKGLPWSQARWLAAAWLVAALGVWACVRTEGTDGALGVKLAWRFLPTDEQRFLAQLAWSEANRPDDPTDASADALRGPIELAPGDWPGFRGPGRDSVLKGVRFPTNWHVQPPRELWRRRVGPGWSSFAVMGDRLFTQEQREDMESIVCYDASTGDELWTADAKERFYRVESGAGPLGTPTFYEGALYATGATGVVQRVDAATGSPGWRRDLTEDLPRKAPPAWGFASSPLLVDTDRGTLAIVYAGNPQPTPGAEAADDQAVIAYLAATGEPVWTGGVGFHGYSSPHPATLGGIEQVLMSSNKGLESLDPATGERLWFYEWDLGEMPRISQPIVIDGQTVLLTSGYGFGSHGIRVTRDGDDWRTETLWESRALKPYFNDAVYYQGHVYGFDDKFFTCLDAETGKATWPKRTRRQTRFGCGQVLLIEDPGLLLVVTELTGEVVLLEANPEKPIELARFTALEGKTWNHPVIAHGRLYVRNGAEMVCYDLPKVTLASKR